MSEEGTHTDQAKWPVSKTIKEVRSYLGFTCYCRRFIQDYAKIARPLNDLLVGHCTSKKKKNQSLRHLFVLKDTKYYSTIGEETDKTTRSCLCRLFKTL